jgi:hypothetical protein
MQVNGKAERFIQTLLGEWAYALPYRPAAAAPPVCRDGSTCTITADPTLASVAIHPLPCSDQPLEQPARNDS